MCWFEKKKKKVGVGVFLSMCESKHEGLLILFPAPKKLSIKHCHK